MGDAQAPGKRPKDDPPICDECGAEKIVAVESRNIRGFLCPNECDITAPTADIPNLSPFTPCAVTVERDPSVVGAQYREHVAHRWNKDLDHIPDHLVQVRPGHPVPLGTVEMMEDIGKRYQPGRPNWCAECFPERGEWDY